ncbi:hypothetical protein EXW32_29110 (plasmid) [Bacillus mycoides]|uniref:hypothetical protein n=1 Tax=Bacillus mycoides TaxID=1405 RepID=UPI001C035220|nr:hypothetical protein [Bacillus mycoides]QWG70404.1 hypothetical protein EXW32_29110 [Bacillus mycoides]
MYRRNAITVTYRRRSEDNANVEHVDSNSSEQSTEDSTIQTGTSDVILDTAKSVYNEEAERFKQAEAKTNITLAFVGVLFGVYLTYLGAFKPPLKEVSYLIYTCLFKLIVFTCFITSIIYFLKSIKTGEYDQVGLDNIVTNDFSKRNEIDAKLAVAGTYTDAVTNNKGRLEEKLKLYGIGLNLMTWGFIIFAIHFVIEEVIRYAK